MKKVKLPKNFGKTKSVEKSEAFLAFHKKNPQMRFFQALLTFTGYKIILVADGDGELKDPFYFEDKK